FITIEGGDGSGKSTQIKSLKEFLENKGCDVVLTREPGGTLISEEIRKIILNKAYMEMSDMTEALLYAAARAQHVDEFIRPHVTAGKMVVCDRYVDSSIVYQGYARGLGMEAVATINQYATGGLKPDLTILLQLSAQEGIKRKSSQQALDRLELQKLEFHQRVSEGYEILARNEKERILIIDATKSVEEIKYIIEMKIETLMDCQ
ncbi:MAG: dTMP kinase, partial [Vallitaleaceae bacterium]|nr:dTMP kinase [Vallitaleaceae bacterium]